MGPLRSDGAAPRPQLNNSQLLALRQHRLDAGRAAQPHRCCCIACSRGSSPRGVMARGPAGLLGGHQRESSLTGERHSPAGIWYRSKAFPMRRSPWSRWDIFLRDFGSKQTTSTKPRHRTRPTPPVGPIFNAAIHWDQPSRSCRATRAWHATPTGYLPLDLEAGVPQRAAGGRCGCRRTIRVVPTDDPRPPCTTNHRASSRPPWSAFSPRRFDFTSPRLERSGRGAAARGRTPIHGPLIKSM